MKLTLTTPIEWGDKIISELEFSELNGKMLRNLKINDMRIGDFLDLGARLTNNPPSFMDKLSGTDAMRVVEITGKLLNSGT